MLYEQAGESYSGGSIGFRCPGEECSNFRKTKGTWEERSEEACTACQKCKGNFPIEGGEVEDDDSDIQHLVDLTEMRIDNDNAGAKTDWEKLDYAYFELFRVWRETEAVILQIQRSWQHAFIKGWLQPKK